MTSAMRALGHDDVPARPHQSEPVSLHPVRDTMDSDTGEGLAEGSRPYGLVTSFQAASIACDCVEDAQLEWLGTRSQGERIKFIDLRCSECGASWEYQVVAVKNPVDRQYQGSRTYEIEPLLKALKLYTPEAFARRTGVSLSNARTWFARGTVPVRVVREITYRAGVNEMHIWGSSV